MGLFDIFSISGSGVGLNRAWMDAVSVFMTPSCSSVAIRFSR